MTNKELVDKIRDEILHLKMKELQRTNGINTGADVYLSSYAVLLILSNALTEESEDERIRKAIIEHFKQSETEFPGLTFGGYYYADVLAYLEKKKEQKPAWSEELDIDTLREWSMRYAPDIRQAIESTAYHFYNLCPHWKPSEEQMEALRKAVNKLAKTDVADSVRLSIIYDNLKKL